MLHSNHKIKSARSIASATKKMLSEYPDSTGSNNVIRHGFDRTIKIKTELSADVSVNGFKRLRKWQLECLVAWGLKRFMLVNAFCGSGKSLAMVSMSAIDLAMSGGKQRQLFVVPQGHQGKAMTTEAIHLPIGDAVWSIPEANVFVGGAKNVVAKLVLWLTNPKSSVSAVCTYAGFVAAWGKLTAAQQRKAMKNLSLSIDESHHLDCVGDETAKNGISKIVGQFVRSKDATTRVRAVTATFYRGDAQPVFSEETMKAFERYSLDWIEHFNTLGIEEIRFETIYFKQDPVDLVARAVASEKNEKHIICLPSTGCKWRDENSLEKLTNAIKRKWKGVRILDLVTPEFQDENKENLRSEPKSFGECESKYDVVIVCAIREGLDWVPCSRLHNTGVENSLTMAVQTFGRPMRKWAGKKIVIVRHYISELIKIKAGASFRELISDRLNALLVAIVLDNSFVPIFAKLKAARAARSGSSGASRDGKRVDLSEILSGKVEPLYTRILGDYERAFSEGGKLTGDEVRGIVEGAIDSLNVDTGDADRDSVIDAIVADIGRIGGVKDMGMDVSFLRINRGVDLVGSVKSLVFNLPILFAKATSQEKRAIRKACEEELMFRSTEECLSVTDQLIAAVEKYGPNVPMSVCRKIKAGVNVFGLRRVDKNRDE